jgi:hypothetical protein
MNDALGAFAVREDLIPGWWVWMSPKSRQWHARKKGSQPPVLVNWDSLEGLKDAVKNT